jgi:hypothetical protein
MRFAAAVCFSCVACSAPAVAEKPPAVAPSITASAPPGPSAASVGARLGGIDVLPTEVRLTKPAPPPTSKEAQIKVEIERPFRLDLRVVPKDRDAFLTDLHERERWNKGELGELTGEAPPVPGHPQPRVIIDVTHVKGPHKAADVQREARRLFWIKVVTCFGLGAYKDQKLRGMTRAVIQVDKNGKVRGSRIASTKLTEEDVPKCFAEELKKLPLPKAKSGSAVTLEIQVSPGDEPMAPPAPLLLPGDGTIDPEAVREVVKNALPTFEGCYRPALAYAPKLWGRLGIRFHQTDKGKIDEAFEAESRFPDERVTLCVLRAARALSFPKPKGGDVRFVIPLRFSTSVAPDPLRGPSTEAAP